MEQKDRRIFVGVEVDPETKQWLDRQAAERLIEGRPFGERSVGAVIREMINERREQAEREAKAA